MRCLWFVLLLALALPLRAADLRIHGSNTIGERLAPALVNDWLQAEGYREITTDELAFEETLIHATRDGQRISIEIHAHGSGTSAKDLIVGAADIGMSSRPITPAEAEAAKAAGLGQLNEPKHELVLALDGLSVVVHPDSPLRHIEKDVIRRLFSGQITDWSQLGLRAGRIALHARDDKSGTWDSFRAMVLGSSPLSPRARRYESTARLAAAVARDPLAIGFVGMSEVKGVKALAISDGAPPVTPDAFHVAVEDYPLSRRLYFYVPASTSELARRFIAYALSDAAQASVERIGFVSQYVTPYPAVARGDAPADYRDIVQGAERLSLNFRFGSGSSFLDSKALRDVDRLTQFMQQPENAGRELRLIGFVDADEVLPYSAWSLSNDRADFIAEVLGVHNVPVARVRGMGGAVPVAANDSEIGRNRNRRVEVWLAEKPTQTAAAAQLGSAASVAPALP
jgi:phosphate transport system substrate-binding protein